MVLHFKQEKVFAYFTKKVYNRPDYILGGTLIMLDIKFLRENPDIVKQNIKNKFQDRKLPLVDEVIALDKESRATQQEADELRAKRKKISKNIGGLMAQGKKEEAEALKAEVAQGAERLAELEKMTVKMLRLNDLGNRLCRILKFHIIRKLWKNLMELIWMQHVMWPETDFTI